MTERLYYDQTYLKEFEATVTGATVTEDGTCLVTLDRSAFYPTSGGQPFDTGVLVLGDQSYPVTEVTVEKEDGTEVFHRVPAGLKPGDRVTGKIDWDRRFDHMQQHGGEHMLAGLIWSVFGGMTIGLHLGNEYSTIDVTLPDGRTRLTDEETEQLEDLVNQRIHEDAPIRCWFPSAEELRSLPLRKAPTVSEHVRIVAMGDFEMVACGGTHPSTTGQIGCIRILSVTPERGKARFAFVCGGRAVRHNRIIGRAADRTGALLSCGAEEIPEAVKNLKERISGLNAELKKTRVELLLLQLQQSECTNGITRFWSDEADPDALTEAVKVLVRTEGRTIVSGTKGRLIFARSTDRGENMGQLIREVGRGGGKPDFATGAGDEAAVTSAYGILTQRVY